MVARVLDSGVLRPVHHLKTWPRVTLFTTDSICAKCYSGPYHPSLLLRPARRTSISLQSLGGGEQSSILDDHACSRRPNALICRSCGEATTGNNEQETRINRGIRYTEGHLMSSWVSRVYGPPQ
jgi:hypothetical protein